MPLTNAEKLCRVRAKKAATVARYEAALRNIAKVYTNHSQAGIIARQALNPDAKTEVS